MTGIHFLDAQGPEGIRLYAIGDVHGRLDLLAAMHEGIAAEIEDEQPPDWRIIHLGDYTDRGPESRGVIDFLIAARERDRRNMMLAGNHDVGFLDFLEAPLTDGLFAHNGGKQTALSYGVLLDFFSLAALRPGHAALVEAVPAAHVAFLRSLQFSAEFGDFFFCHAGIRPGVPLERQVPEDLVWIRDEFLDYTGLHPKVIVHGHTPAAEPEVLANRVNVDTGAFHSGRLTALAIDGAQKRLLEVGG
jgi:serine/threonine protein phosphatase 1